MDKVVRDIGLRVLRHRIIKGPWVAVLALEPFIRTGCLMVTVWDQTLCSSGQVNLSRKLLVSLLVESVLAQCAERFLVALWAELE